MLELGVSVGVWGYSVTHKVVYLHVEYLPTRGVRHEGDGHGGNPNAPRQHGGVVVEHHRELAC